MTNLPEGPEFWSEMNANEVRLFIGEPVMGFWCWDCQLPSGWQAPVQRDPAEEPGAWFSGCVENSAHRNIEDPR